MTAFISTRSGQAIGLLWKLLFVVALSICFLATVTEAQQTGDSHQFHLVYGPSTLSLWPLTETHICSTSGADSGPGTLRQALYSATLSPSLVELVVNISVSLSFIDFSYCLSRPLTMLFLLVWCKTNRLHESNKLPIHGLKVEVAHYQREW